MYLNHVGTIIGGSALVAALGGIAYAEWRRNRAERGLQRLSEQIHRSRTVLRSRGQLIDEIAHEIKSPLSAIISAADALLIIFGRDLPPDQKSSLVHLKDQSDSVFRIVSDLIEVSRLDGEIVPSSSEELSLDAVAQAMLNLMKGKCMSRSITPKFQASRMPIHVKCDGRQLRQVVLNVLRIAIDRSVDGGKMKIYCEAKKNTAESAVLVVELNSCTSTSNRPEGPGNSVAELAKTYIQMVLETNGGNFTESPSQTGGYVYSLELPAVQAPAHLKVEAPSPQCFP